jgi:hypothetical protein
MGRRDGANNELSLVLGLGLQLIKPIYAIDAHPADAARLAMAVAAEPLRLTKQEELGCTTCLAEACLKPSGAVTTLIWACQRAGGGSVLMCRSSSPTTPRGEGSRYLYANGPYPTSQAAYEHATRSDRNLTN